VPYGERVSDVNLVEAFRRGEPDAFRRMYAEFARLVYSISHHVLGERSLAEEAMQETFVSAWDNAGKFESGRELGPWLAVIARRAAIDIWRRERRREHDSLDEFVGIADSTSETEVEEIWAIRTALSSLDAGTRSLLELQYRDGFSQREVAERLNNPVGTVKSRTHTAQGRLAIALRREHVNRRGDAVPKTKRDQK
jgi:RNA polymerase sigma-70 factor, ECF subfamily